MLEVRFMSGEEFYLNQVLEFNLWVSTRGYDREFQALLSIPDTTDINYFLSLFFVLNCLS